MLSSRNNFPAIIVGSPVGASLAFARLWARNERGGPAKSGGNAIGMHSTRSGLRYDLLRLRGYSTGCVAFWLLTGERVFTEFMERGAGAGLVEDARAAGVTLAGVKNASGYGLQASGYRKASACSS